MNVGYESTLVEREMLLKRSITVNRPFASFPNLRVIQNAMIPVQMKRVRCQRCSGVNGASKHTPLPSRIAFATLASCGPYHRKSPPLLSRHLV